MDSSDPEELGQVLGIGDHCSVDHCRQIDFLPFKCDCCNRIYCLEHRSYTAHACPKAGAKETTVIVCPLCAKSVRLTPGQDANAAFDVHQRTDCDPSNYERVHKKPRCPVGGCKEKLTMINAYRCKHCTQRVCLRHRDPGDHKCTEYQAALRQHRGAAFGSGAATAAAATATTSGRSSGATSAASSRPSSAPRVPTTAAATAAAPGSGTAGTLGRRTDPQQLHAAALRQFDDPSNSVRGTAERRATQLQQQQQFEEQRRQEQGAWWSWQSQPQPQTQPPPQRQPPPQAQLPPRPAPPTRASGATADSNANPLVPPHLPEKCPQCGASFATVERLIQHVEDFHPSTGPSAAASGAAGGWAGAGAGTAPGRPAGGSPVFTNPLRGLMSTTIAGGAAPEALQGTGSGGAGGGAGAGNAGGREVFRCHFCSRTFHDPVLLVQHSDRCGAASSGAAAAGGVGRRGGSGGGARGAGADKDGCLLC